MSQSLSGRDLMRTSQYTLRIERMLLRVASVLLVFVDQSRLYAFSTFQRTQVMVQDGLDQIWCDAFERAMRQTGSTGVSRLDSHCKLTS